MTHEQWIDEMCRAWRMLIDATSDIAGTCHRYGIGPDPINLNNNQEK